MKDMELEITETKRLLIRDSEKAVTIYYQEWEEGRRGHDEWRDRSKMRVEK